MHPAFHGAGRGRLTSEFETLEPTDGFPLMSNDLRLPNEGNGHQAHRQDAKCEHDSDVRFVGGDTKGPVKPGHSESSPSTRSAHSLVPKRILGYGKTDAHSAKRERAIEGPPWISVCLRLSRKKQMVWGGILAGDKDAAECRVQRASLK